MNNYTSCGEMSKVSSSISICSIDAKYRTSVAFNESGVSKSGGGDVKNSFDESFTPYSNQTIPTNNLMSLDKNTSLRNNDSKTSTKVAQIVEPDLSGQRDREPSRSPISVSKSTSQPDIATESGGELTTSSSNQCTYTAIDNHAVANLNNDLKNNPENQRVTERKGKAKVIEAPKKRTRKKWKKPVGKPNRPLSAYNLYFRKERAVMLGDAAEKIDQEQGKKRVHRKTHGKIGFAEMARVIGAKWKALPEEEKKEFTKIAVVEKERYAKDLANWREEQKKKTLIDSMAQGRKSKINDSFGKEFDDEDDLVKSISEDRKIILRQHQAFRMQMMQEMQVGHLGRLPGEGPCRQMPTMDYLRNTQDDRTIQFFGRNQNGPSRLFSHYPSAAEGSGRDLYQQMVAMTSGPGRQGREPGLRHLKMAQIINGSMIDGPGSSVIGGALGDTMRGSLCNTMSNSMGAPMGNTMGNNFGDPMINRNTIENSMGMIPMSKGAPHLSHAAPHSQYDKECYQQTCYQNLMYGINNNQMQICTKLQAQNNNSYSPSDMTSHKGSDTNNRDVAMGRFEKQNRYN